VYFVAGEDGLGRALAHSDVIVMDEVGPMELVSDEFVQAVLKAIGSNKQVI
jgi:nucleoside-triphosphatase THEP1